MSSTHSHQLMSLHEPSRLAGLVKIEDNDREDRRTYEATESRLKTSGGIALSCLFASTSTPEDLAPLMTLSNADAGGGIAVRCSAPEGGEAFLKINNPQTSPSEA